MRPGFKSITVESLGEQLAALRAKYNGACKTLDFLKKKYGK